MPQEANSCVRISADPPSLNRDVVRGDMCGENAEPVHRFPSLSLAVLFAASVVLVAPTILPGCVSTTPRFHSPPDTDDAAWDDAASAATVRKESAQEDDRKVDVHKAASTLAHANSSEDDTPPGVSRDRVLLNIIDFLGVPYRYGGATKQGIDCSGFTSVIYANAANRPIPRSTRDQYKLGTNVSHGKLRFGDLVFFNTTGRRPSHVGIFLENNLFAHASISEGVTLSSLESTYYKKRYIGARRIIE